MATQFGRYQVIRELGRGGMGTVYLAFDPRFEREVALKVLPAGFLQDDSFRSRFDREAKIVARLDHPAIVPVYDTGEEHGCPYLVMRLMAGGTLRDRVAAGPMPLEQVNVIMQRICSALDRAHAGKVVHRDLKPGNILFDADGEAFLADFGIARLLETSQTYTAIGTPQYLTPEQVHGWPVDARTDVYQMGVVLFEMLTGRVPYDAQTPAALVHQHGYAPVPSARALNPRLAPAVDAVIAKAMAKDPEMRYRSAGALASAVATLVSRGQAQPAQLAATDYFQPIEIQRPPARATPPPAQATQRPAQATQRPAAVPRPAEQAERPAPAERPRRPAWLWVVAGLAGLAAVVATVILITSLAKPEELAEATATTTVMVALPTTPAPLPSVQPTNPTGPAPSVTPSSLLYIVQPGDTLRVIAQRFGVTAQEIAQANSLADEDILLVGSSLIINARVTPTFAPAATRDPAAGMVLVAAGEFIMGSAEGEGRAVERPAHTVHLNAFYIDRTEVTVADYRLCLEAETCRFPTSTCQGAPNLDNADQMNHPVVCISWHDARAYCAWAGKRLPTEAEWEKAGRGSAAGASSNRTYPWGEGIDCAMANYLGCVGGTAPVGSYPAGASPYGTLDMAGNVWEWVSDWHAGDYYWHSPGRNPTGPATGGEKVVRGGGWEITPDYLRMAYRSNVSPDTLADYIGFRCVLDAAE